MNSTVVDLFFRQFNGHTQVNATDLRNIKYPTLNQLRALGARILTFPTQEEVDELIEEVLLSMPEAQQKDLIDKKKRIEEALEILKVVGLRSALTLLALLDLKPDVPWSKASAPLCGITPMMDFFARHYKKVYKPNTRETVGRQTVHQFHDAGLIITNPDDPERPTTSPKAVYQIEQGTLDLLRTFGTDEWEQNLKTYVASIETLRKRYAQEREMKRIPLRVASAREITLSSGGQNILVKRIIDDFAPYYTPGAVVLYVGDTDNKFAYFDKEKLEALGVNVEEHGKIPDVIVHHTEKDWLVLIEAVTSHGPIDPKRLAELKNLFRDYRIGLVFVTAFLTRKTMMAYLNEISWETEVWMRRLF